MNARTRLRRWLATDRGHWIPPLLWMGLIFLLSSRADYPSLTPSRPDIQNVAGHLLLYGVLALLLIRAFQRFRPQNRPHLWTMITVMLYAASDEWHQTFVPGREGDPKDWVVDVIGALLALGLRRWWLRRRRRDPLQARPESRSRRTAPAARR